MVLGFGFWVFWGLFSFSLGTKAGVVKYRPDAMQTDGILDTPFGWPGTKAGVVKCRLDGVQTDGILDDLIGCFRSTSLALQSPPLSQLSHFSPPFPSPPLTLDLRPNMK